MVLTANEKGDIRIWDRAERRLLSQFSISDWFTAAAFSPDGRAVLIGGREKPPQWWDTATGKRVDLPLGEKETIWWVGFSPDGRRMLTTTNYNARLWDRATGQLQHEWAGVGEPPEVRFSPDGSQVLLVGGGFARVADVATGAILGPPRAAQFQAEGGIRKAAFHPNGQAILISSKEGIARLWDVAAGKPLGPPLSRDAAGPVACAPDGRWLAVADRQGRVGLWEMPPRLARTVEHVRLWVEVHTGMELNDQEEIHALDADALAERRRRLEERGGPPVP
jgi:WD40 repeat protein